MEGVHRGGSRNFPKGTEDMGTEVPQWGHGAKPWQEVAESTYEISIQFLTFFCRKFRT